MLLRKWEKLNYNPQSVHLTLVKCELISHALQFQQLPSHCFNMKKSSPSSWLVFVHITNEVLSRGTIYLCTLYVYSATNSLADIVVRRQLQFYYGCQRNAVLMKRFLFWFWSQTKSSWARSSLAMFKSTRPFICLGSINYIFTLNYWF